MLVLLSPAKTLDFSGHEQESVTQPRLLDRSNMLIKTLRNKPLKELQRLMGISKNLAKVNRERYAEFHTPFTPDNAKPAVLAFDGDVYLGLQAKAFDQDELAFAQKYVRILSGLYGLLRPLDLMQPYRLEMGTKLKTRKGTNLYDFWDNYITKLLKEDLEALGNPEVINLASREYFKVLKVKKIPSKIVDIHFRERKDGEYRFISFNAKKARGLMTQYMVKHRLQKADELKDFDMEGYSYHAGMSDSNTYYFTREAAG